MIGFLRMSGGNARSFLADLRNGRSPIVAKGDEDDTVEIEFEITEAGHVFVVRKSGQRHDLHRYIINRNFDLQTMSIELLADLGA